MEHLSSESPLRKSRLTDEQIRKARVASRLLIQAEAQHDKPESQPSVVQTAGQVAIRSEYIAGGYQVL